MGDNISMNKFLVKNPIISEKTTQLAALRKYVFLVDKNSAAPEIKKIIEDIYKVNIVSANIVNVKSKKRRLGMSIGTKSGYKKIIVTLKSGQKLDIIPQ